MENKYGRCCEIVTENHKPITGLDSNQFAFRLRAEQKRALQHDQLVSALTLSDTVDFEQIAADVAVSFGRKSPVSVLMEHAQYSRSKVNFVEVGEPDGPQHKPVLVALRLIRRVIQYCCWFIASEFLTINCLICCTVIVAVRVSINHTSAASSVPATHLSYSSL